VQLLAKWLRQRLGDRVAGIVVISRATRAHRPHSDPAKLMHVRKRPMLILQACTRPLAELDDR
jgi:hypothetical protein